MACGPVTYSQKMGSLHDLGKCSASQAEVKHNSTESTEAHSSHTSWNKPVKLNLDELLRPGSVKKMTQRELFGPGRNLLKDIQNKTGARKTLSALPRPGINRSKPSVGQSQYPSYRRDSQMCRRKTQVPLAPSYTTKTQKISASSAKKEAVKFKNPGSSVTAIASRQVNVSRKVTGHIPRLANLENSVNLLNVDDVEEKLVNEASLLKSRLLKQIHKNTREVNACDVTNEQKILNEQTVINEKLKNMDEKLKNVDEKLDKALHELVNLKEIIKNLSLNQDTERESRSCHCYTTTVTKSSEITATNNLEQKVIQLTSDEPMPDTDNCVPGSESKTYSLRRSLRLNNKGAQYAFESLRKSTKLLTTPQAGSTKKTNTPGRLRRKVIAQLNELYHD